MKKQDKYKWEKNCFIDICQYMYKEVSGPQKIQKEDYRRNCKKKSYHGVGLS